MIIEQVDNKNGETHYLIPAALNNEKNEEWMSWQGEVCPYFYIIGRVCSTDRLINPSTLTKILHTVRKEFAREKIAFFQGGFYIKTQTSHILVEPVSSYRGFKAKLGILKSRAGTNKEELKMLIKQSGAHFDKVFSRICCGCTMEANPLASINRKVLSLEGMKKGDDSVCYDLSDVQRHYRDCCKFIDSDTERSDITTLLLTWTEMDKERNTKVNVTIFVFKKFYLTSAYIMQCQCRYH